MISLIVLYLVLGAVALGALIRNLPHETHFSIAEDFSRHPAGARMIDGPHSGEALRQRLIDLLTEYRAVVVDLDGTCGYGSSFLKAAFEGLGQDRIKLITQIDHSLILEINEYL